MTEENDISSGTISVIYDNASKESITIVACEDVTGQNEQAPEKTLVQACDELPTEIITSRGTNNALQIIEVRNNSVKSTLDAEVQMQNELDDSKKEVKCDVS